MARMNAYVGAANSAPRLPHPAQVGGEQHGDDADTQRHNRRLE
jgi:hypothetical protein